MTEDQEIQSVPGPDILSIIEITTPHILASDQRIVQGSKRADVVNSANIQNGMTIDEIAIRIDKALSAMGE